MSKESHIGCKEADPELFRVVSVCQEFLKIKRVSFEIEQRCVSTTFIYFVEVKNTGLSGYIGRDQKKNKIVYVITDAGRLNWALQEGFTRTEAFELVGLFKEAVSVASFSKWISGGEGYKLKGEYITSKKPDIEAK